MDADFQDLLAGAAAVLRELPRHGPGVENAKARFKQFAASHPGFRCDLLVTRKPGSEVTDYDVLLGTADGGTLALSWEPDEGIPWIPQHADHWAANFVLTVNGRNTSIQSALVYLSAVQRRRPNLMEELVNGALILEAVNASPPSVSEAELQKAVDDYRIGLGLRSAEATRHWLKETGLTPQGLRELAYPRASARKFREGITSAGARPYFLAHRSAFDILTVFRLRVASDEAGEKLARAARKSGFWTALRKLQSPGGSVETQFAREFPAGYSAAAPDTVVGPEREPDGSRTVGVPLCRKPARFDARTRARIQDLLFQDWIAERRAQASVRWHWM